MNKNELRRLILQKEKEFQKAKLKRVIKSGLIFVVGYYLLLSFLGEGTEPDVIDRILISIVLAVINLFSGSVIFYQLFDKNEAERKQLEELEREWSKTPY